MADTMQAIQRNASTGKFTMQEVKAPKSPSKPDRVIIKVAFAGLCGTDLLIFAGHFPCKPDVISGHRFSGVVSQIGADVRACKVGDRVAVNPSELCGSCKFCKKGKTQHCITGGMRSVYGIGQNGGFAEYAEIPASQVEVLPARLTLKQAILSEPLSCVVHSYQLCSNLIHGDSKVLVMGSGLIGLLWMSLLSHRGFRDVTVTEPVQKRRSLAKNLVPEYKVHHPDDLSVSLGKIDAEVDGFDVVVDCCGHPEAFKLAYPLLSRGATYLMFGVGSFDAAANMRLSDLVMKETRIQGSIINPGTFPETIDLLHNFCVEEKISLDKLGVVTFPFKDYEKSCKLFETLDVSQVVLEVGGEMAEY